MSDDTTNTESILKFPCEISVKAMGLSTHDDFQALIVEIVSVHVPGIDSSAARTRSSRGGKYLSVTVTFEASSRQQLDAIYYAFTNHQDVLMSI